MFFRIAPRRRKQNKHRRLTRSQTLVANQNKPAGGYNSAGVATSGAGGGPVGVGGVGSSSAAASGSGGTGGAANASSVAFDQSRDANNILGADLEPAEQEATAFGYAVGHHNGDGPADY